MKRLIWLPLAGFLLVAGAAIATAAAAPSVTPSAQTNQDVSPAPTAAAPSPGANNLDGTPGHGMFAGGADLLNQVLSDLVKAGTITQDQSDAITKALQQSITDQRTQAEQDRQKAMQEWQQIQGFLQDGVITQDEVNQLPADSPFRQIFNSIAQNGQITVLQLQQLRMFGPGGMGPGGGSGFNPRGSWGGQHWGNGGSQGQNPQASPSTTSTS